MSILNIVFTIINILYYNSPESLRRFFSQVVCNKFTVAKCRELISRVIEFMSVTCISSFIFGLSIKCFK